MTVNFTAEQYALLTQTTSVAVEDRPLYLGLMTVWLNAHERHLPILIDGQEEWTCLNK